MPACTNQKTKSGRRVVVVLSTTLHTRQTGCHQSTVTLAHPTRLSPASDVACTAACNKTGALLMWLLSLIATLLNATGQAANHALCNCKPATLASPAGVAQVLRETKTEKTLDPEVCSCTGQTHWMHTRTHHAELIQQPRQDVHGRKTTAKTTALTDSRSAISLCVLIKEHAPRFIMMQHRHACNPGLSRTAPRRPRHTHSWHSRSSQQIEPNTHAFQATRTCRVTQA